MEAQPFSQPITNKCPHLPFLVVGGGGTTRKDNRQRLALLAQDRSQKAIVIVSTMENLGTADASCMQLTLMHFLHGVVARRSTTASEAMVLAKAGRLTLKYNLADFDAQLALGGDWLILLQYKAVHGPIMYTLHSSDLQLPWVLQYGPWGDGALANICEKLAPPGPPWLAQARDKARTELQRTVSGWDR